MIRQDPYIINRSDMPDRVPEPPQYVLWLPERHIAIPCFDKNDVKGMLMELPITEGIILPIKDLRLRSMEDIEMYEQSNFSSRESEKDA